MSRSKISAALIARNESANISEAIKSLSFADQIVVADTGSTDDTVEIAQRLGAEVHSVEFEGFGKTKNRALDFCRGDWVLFIDADERVTTELADKVLNTAGNESATSGFLINRLTYFLGKPVRHSGWYPDYVLRFFKRQNGKFSINLVHECVEVDGTVGKLEGLLLHYSYRSLDQYLDKLNEYSSLSAKEMFENGKKFNILDLLFRPISTFFKMFVFKAGFLDGLNGFILAVLSSYHVFVKYAKLHNMWRTR
jgi:glycosyltransferase involved in cell wall biosynthesis